MTGVVAMATVSFGAMADCIFLVERQENKVNAAPIKNILLVIFINQYALLFTRMTKATRISRSRFQFYYLCPFSFLNFLGDHLCDSVTRLYDLFFL